MVLMVWPGTKMVTARSLSGGRLSAMGSLTTSAPAGMSTAGCPWKSAGTEVPLMVLPVSVIATAATTNLSVAAPKALLRTIRRLEPPRETCTISRRVVSSENRLLLLLEETGAVDQVPTQRSWALAPAVMVIKAISNREARNCGAERRVVRVISGQVY